jgi:hypothetical protein
MIVLMQSTLRPMRPDELENLKRRYRVPANYVGVFIAAFGTAVIAALVGLLVSATGILSKRTADQVTEVLIGVALLGSFPYYLRKELRRAKRSAEYVDSRYGADAANQQIEEWRIHIVDAIEVEEFEDEGRHCYLELEDGRVLFLSGPHLYDSDEDDITPRFPNRELLITRFPRTGDIYDIERLGEYFPPSLKLPPFTKEDHEADRVPEDGQILPGPLSRYTSHQGL